MLESTHHDPPLWSHPHPFDSPQSSPTLLLAQVTTYGSPPTTATSSLSPSCVCAAAVGPRRATSLDSVRSQDVNWSHSMCKSLFLEETVREDRCFQLRWRSARCCSVLYDTGTNKTTLISAQPRVWCLSTGWQCVTLGGGFRPQLCPSLTTTCRTLCVSP